MYWCAKPNTVRRLAPVDATTLRVPASAPCGYAEPVYPRSCSHGSPPDAVSTCKRTALAVAPAQMAMERELFVYVEMADQAVLAGRP